MNRSFILPVVAAAALGYTYWQLRVTSAPIQQTQPAETPTSTPFQAALVGAGIVEPCSELVEVASDTPGVIETIAVKVGDKVTKGDVLFQLDCRRERAELEVRQAELESAETSLARLKQLPRPEDVPPSEARVNRYTAELAWRKDRAERGRRLGSQDAIAAEDVVARERELQTSEASLKEAAAEHKRLLAGAWNADVAIAERQIGLARKQVEQAEIELNRRTVRSPLDATVLRIDVHLGEYVGTPPDAPLLTLGDVEQLNVRVDIDEQDIPRFREGMPGKAFVRGNAVDAIPLKFVRVEPLAKPKKSLTGASVERIDTRVLQAIYRIAPGSVRAYAGQQVEVYLDADGDKSAQMAQRQ